MVAGKKMNHKGHKGTRRSQRRETYRGLARMNADQKRNQLKITGGPAVPVRLETVGQASSFA
jgi:hypothetical protein